MVFNVLAVKEAAMQIGPRKRVLKNIGCQERFFKVNQMMTFLLL